MKSTAFLKNVAVFAGSLLVGAPAGAAINAAANLTGTVAQAVTLVTTFVIYVFAVRWFKAKPSLDG